MSRFSLYVLLIALVMGLLIAWLLYGVHHFPQQPISSVLMLWLG